MLANPQITLPVEASVEWQVGVADEAGLLELATTPAYFIACLLINKSTYQLIN